MSLLLVPGFMADHTLWRDNEALIERVRAMGPRPGDEVFRRQSMLERPATSIA